MGPVEAYTIEGKQKVRFDSAPLGEGGQGQVFRAQFNGRAVAVKLYHRHAVTPDLMSNLSLLVERGAPSDHFIFPIQLVQTADGSRQGYVMELLDRRFRGVEHIVTRKVAVSMEMLIVAARQLCDAFLKLHARGLCYRDVSFFNVFIDPHTGDVRIIDNDNVTVNDAARSSVSGTPRFMAPEVVRGEARPSAATDQYSLAVLLFYLLFNGHPLDGQREANFRCIDEPVLRKLYGEEPVYIFHPTDRSNAPVPGLHDNPIAFSRIYPEIVLGSFEKAFTSGLRPDHRVLDSEWRKVMDAARDSLIHCFTNECGAENFWQVTGNSAVKCWKCGARIAPRCILRFDVSGIGPVAVEPGKRLFPHHLLRQMGNFERAIATAMRGPSPASVLLLRNDSDSGWTVRDAVGTNIAVQRGQTAALQIGSTLQFGMVSARVE
jgi:DNA-binding helix-hairpin-helix protein with protein kinase domain